METLLIPDAPTPPDIVTLDTNMEDTVYGTIYSMFQKEIVCLKSVVMSQIEKDISLQVDTYSQSDFTT
jgi:hypothetical protein